MSRELVERLRTKLAKATKRPWRVFAQANVIAIMKGNRPRGERRWPEIVTWAGFDGTDVGRRFDLPNAELIVEAVNALPDLLDEITRLRSLVGEGEPVAWMYERGDFRTIYMGQPNQEGRHNPAFTETPLYTHPQAKPTGVVTCPICHDADDREHCGVCGNCGHLTEEEATIWLRAQSAASTPVAALSREDLIEILDQYYMPKKRQGYAADAILTHLAPPAPVDADLREAVARIIAGCGVDAAHECDDPKAAKRRFAREGAEATLSLIASKSVPEGYVLVPREPTEAMIEAAAPWSPLGDVAREIWPAMISAAAQPEQEGK